MNKTKLKSRSIRGRKGLTNGRNGSHRGYLYHQRFGGAVIFMCKGPSQVVTKRRSTIGTRDLLLCADWPWSDFRCNIQGRTHIRCTARMVGTCGAFSNAQAKRQAITAFACRYKSTNRFLEERPSIQRAACWLCADRFETSGHVEHDLQAQCGDRSVSLAAEVVNVRKWCQLVRCCSCEFQGRLFYKIPENKRCLASSLSFRSRIHLVQRKTRTKRKEGWELAS